jgi:hypothetical protein
MKKTLRLPLLFIIISFLAISDVYAQNGPEQELDLRLTRNVGYSNPIGTRYWQIQGSFTARVQGPASLERVEFYIGEQLLGQVSEYPYNFRFHTDNYPAGVHHFSAIGYTTSGVILQSNIVVAEIVTASDSGRFMVYILVPLFGIVILSMVLPVILIRSKKKSPPPAGTPRNYGRSGGGICSRCQRPFPFTAFSPNLGPGLIIASCPYCRKTGIVRRKSLEELRAAEEAELRDAKISKAETGSTMSDEDKLRKELDDSRFQ